MPTIAKNTQYVTLINVFTVESENQQRLIDLLIRSTTMSVKDAPSFISASLHRSLDGTKVTMYAQWRSKEDYEAMRNDASRPPTLQEALTFAKFDPGMYEVVEIFSGKDEAN
jgi:quinol monooxygenase YgiN